MARDSEDSPPSPIPLEALFERYFESVVHWFLHRGIERERAKELTQDVFLLAHRGLDGFRGDSQINTWLFHIVRNAYRNELRGRSALKRDAREISLASGGPGDLDDERYEIDPPDPGSPTPESAALTSERSSALLIAIDELPPKMRQTVQLRLADLKYREIATIMHLSIESVKSHLHQARARLRPVLETFADGELPTRAGRPPIEKIATTAPGETHGD